MAVTLNLRTQDQREAAGLPPKPWGRRGLNLWPRPHLAPGARASSTHPNSQDQKQSAAEGTRTGLCPCRVTLAMCPQFPHPQSEAKPPWPPPPHGLSVGSAPSTHSCEVTPAPLPTRIAAASPAAPSAPTRATCDLGDERFRHQRHVGGEVLRAHLSSAALRALPRALGVDPPQLRSLRRCGRWGQAELTSATVAGPARLPPGRARTSGVADSARRHFRLLRPASSGPARA